MPVRTRSTTTTEKEEETQDLKHHPEIHALSSWCYYPKEHKPKPLMTDSIYASVYYHLSLDKADLIRRIFFSKKM